jgi:aspartyl/asparaginyl-tRNA synthetase
MSATVRASIRFRPSCPPLSNYESEVKHLTAGAGVIVTGTLVPSQGKGQAFELQADV